MIPRRHHREQKLISRLLSNAMTQGSDEVSACEEFEFLLSGYQDGELGTVSRWRVERHLALCPGCTRALQSLKKISACVKEKEAALGHPDLWEKIRISLPAIDAEIEVQNTSLWRRIRVALQKPVLANWDFSPTFVGSAALFLMALAIFKLQSQTEVDIRAVQIPSSVETKMPRANWAAPDPMDVQRARTFVNQRGVQSLNARGHSVMLLQDDPSTTIIWVMDPEEADGTTPVNRSGGEDFQNAAGELL